MNNEFNLECLILSIEKLCKQKNMSVKSVLEECGLTRNVIDNMKKGSVPSIDKIFALSNYFGCSMDDLLGKNIDNSDNSFKIGDMSNVNNNVMGNNNNVHQQPQENKNYGRYDELIDYLDDLPKQERRYAIASVLNFLEDNFPKKNEI